MWAELGRAMFGRGTWGTGGNLVADALGVVPTVAIAAWRHRRAMHARLDRIEAALGLRAGPSGPVPGGPAPQAASMPSPGRPAGRTGDLPHPDDS